ncbi:MAG: hypothetical protein E6R13_05675 [Spirochaetes bacterium]|nr:MAG: hypothetical protein E6R13_05675 [Spirochaetota bacterium]
MKYAKQDYTYDEAVKMLNIDGCMIRYIKNPTPEMCMLAVQNNGDSIRYIESTLRTEELCIAAVSEFGLAIQHIDNPSYNVCRAAIKNDPLSLRFIDNQFEELCVTALNTDIYALTTIKNEYFTKRICEVGLKDKWGEKYLHTYHSFLLKKFSLIIL